MTPTNSQNRTAARQPNFDRVARPYRWMEYVTFGPLLERCRFTWLDHLGDPRSALVLGDGDGRFLGRLLRRYPALSAHIIDLSPRMCELAQQRAESFPQRATFQCADIRECPLPAGPFDLVTAHFFLDCLSAEETYALVRRIVPHLAANAIILVSEFAIPARQPLRFAGTLLVTLLYCAFAALTGLKTRKIPDHAAVFQQAGLTLTKRRTFVGGILRSEIWQTGLSTRVS